MSIHRPEFRSARHLAHAATTRVRYNLIAEDVVPAAILQSVAAAAWTLVDDPAAAPDLERVTLNAVLSLPTDHAERAFLNTVLDYLRSVPPTPAATERGVPRLDVVVPSGLDECRHAVRLALAYLDASAAAAQASIMFDLARAAALASDGEVLDESLAAAAPMLERAAAACATASELLAATPCAEEAAFVAHRQDLLALAAAFRADADAFAAITDDGADDADRDESELDDEILDEVLMEFLEGRAVIFQAKSDEFATSAALVGRAVEATSGD